MDNNENNNIKKVVVITKQVNQSIDEEKIKETNNKIKTKEIPLFVKFLSVVATIMLIFFVSFYAIKYTKKFIKAGESTTTQSTTSSNYSRSEDYWKKNTVRRYVKDKKILLFLPAKLYNYVYLIDYEDSEIDTIMGTYDDHEVNLTMDDIFTLKISDNGITLNDEEYKISSGEFKYYTYKEGDISSILLINASSNALNGLFIDPSRTAYSGKYMEYDDKIVLQCTSGDIVFEKNLNQLSYNGINLTLAS